MKKKAIMLLALAAAMTMSACGGDNGGTEEEVTAANGSVSEEKTTTEKETEKETEETTTEATTVAEPENELLAYYKPLSEEYEKYKGKKVTSRYTFSNAYNDEFAPMAEYNNVLYFHNETNNCNEIYSYNIDTKEYKKILDLYNIEFPNAPSNAFFGLDFLDGYFYVDCYVRNSEIQANEFNSLYKMDLEGNIVQSVSFDKALFAYVYSDGSIIYAENNSAAENADASGYVYSVISPDFKTTTEIKAPEIEAEHGIMEKIAIGTLRADSDGNLFCSVLSGREAFYMKKGTDEWVDLGEFYSIQNLAGKYCIVDGKTIIDMENGGEVVAESSIDWYDYHGFSATKNYFCGDGNMILHDGAWYKVQIPSDGSNIDFSQYEPMGKESRSENNIIPVNDTYYLYHDDYGYFLHTYEKGEEEEETIVLFEE